jgi:precorrin-6A/cobalt-precorrin-6A reductase
VTRATNVRRATVLILGGTGEARELAGLLAAEAGLRVVSSLAGRVRDPALPVGEVRIGGFGGTAGLAEWLRDQQVAAVVDATHPFAQTISANAAAACGQSGTPLLSLVRSAWTPEAGDKWHEVGSLEGAAAALPSLGRRAFVTTGRQGLAAFAPLARTWFLIRCVDPPAGPLPAARQVILARGPYNADAEHELMRRHEIDVLVTKNSGGALTSGKLTAARRLGLPVIMVRRPPLPLPLPPLLPPPLPQPLLPPPLPLPLPDAPRCSSAADAAQWILDQLPCATSRRTTSNTSPSRH